MSELTSTRIREAAERLGLTHLPDHVPGLVARAEAEQLGYYDFLDLVLGEEVELREQKRFRNALKLSGLPERMTRDIDIKLTSATRSSFPSPSTQVPPSYTSRHSRSSCCST